MNPMANSGKSMRVQGTAREWTGEWTGLFEEGREADGAGL